MIYLFALLVSFASAEEVSYRAFTFTGHCEAYLGSEQMLVAGQRIAHLTQGQGTVNVLSLTEISHKNSDHHPLLRAALADRKFGNSAYYLLGILQEGSQHRHGTPGAAYPEIKASWFYFDEYLGQFVIRRPDSTPAFHIALISSEEIKKSFVRFDPFIRDVIIRHEVSHLEDIEILMEAARGLSEAQGLFVDFKIYEAVGELRAYHAHIDFIRQAGARSTLSLQKEIFASAHVLEDLFKSFDLATRARFRQAMRLSDGSSLDSADFVTYLRGAHVPDFMPTLWRLGAITRKTFSAP